jgi:sugar (pentulose or hexulose) kinase
MPMNSITQLLSLVVYDSPVLKITDKFLMVPDLFNYWLTGRAVAEFTEATTTQLFDPHKGNWSKEIINAMGFPHHIFPEIVQPGTILGPLRQSVAKELKTDLTVVAPATHDTGSAVAAVPAEGNDFAWISSGTWSIVGMNVPEPVINEDGFKYNFTNEGGIGGTYRFSKNVMGLWVVQQCRNEWVSEGKNYSYGELTKMAADVPLSTSFVDPDYSSFFKPGNMVEKVQEYCKMTGQTVPITEGEVIRAVLLGLALRYRYVIEKLEEISGKNLSVVHIVGGGTQNKLLSQMTADALGRKVITGPIEATAIGNIIVQAIAMGDIKDWKTGVEVIKNSFEIQTFMPGDKKPWGTAFEKFVSNLEKTTLAF